MPSGKGLDAGSRTRHDIGIKGAYPMNRPATSSRGVRILLSLLFFLVGILALTASLENLVERTPVSQLDERASSYYDGAVTKALATYAAARMLNAGISAVQGTELALSPAGVGVRLSVGEILDPINDLIERFSWIMLLSTVSLGIQKALLEIGVWVGFRVLLLLAMAALLAGLWLPLNAGRTRLWTLGFRILLVAVVVRFCIPIVGVTSQALYDAFFADTYNRSTESLEVIRGKVHMPIAVPNQGEEKEGGSLLESLRKRAQDTKDVLNVQARLEALKDTVEDGIDHIMSLITVFLLQTVVIPLLVLWGLIRLSGSLVRAGGTPGGIRRIGWFSAGGAEGQRSESTS